MKKVNESVVVVMMGLLFIGITVFVGLYQRSNSTKGEVMSETDELSPEVTLVEDKVEETVIQNELESGEANVTVTKNLSSTPTQKSSSITPTNSALINGINENSEITNTQVPIQNGTPTLTPTGSIVHATGSVVENNEKVDFWVDFPSNGGAMSGQGSGICDGFITGTFFANSQVVSGSLDGSCSINGENRPVTGDYSGNIRVTNGNGGGTWEGKDDQGNTKSGTWEIIFDPI